MACYARRARTHVSGSPCMNSHQSKLAHYDLRLRNPVSRIALVRNMENLTVAGIVNAKARIANRIHSMSVTTANRSHRERWENPTFISSRMAVGSMP
jgi:hypothetical protein